MQGLAPVRQGVFFRRRQLGHGFAQGREEEQGIVAEAPFAPGGGENFPVPFPFRDEGLGIVGVAHEDQQADVMGAPVGLMP